MSTPNADRPPLNFNPADGTYVFRVGKLKDTDVRKSSNGNGMVNVPFISESLFPMQVTLEDGTTKIVDSNLFVKCLFFATPKAVPRALELIEAATGARPASSGIKDEFDLANAIHAISGKKVTATIKKGEPRANGKCYYEIGGFKAPF